jgi:hypothetical protein
MAIGLKPQSTVEGPTQLWTPTLLREQYLWMSLTHLATTCPDIRYRWGLAGCIITSRGPQPSATLKNCSMFPRNAGIHLPELQYSDTAQLTILQIFTTVKASNLAVTTIPHLTNKKYLEMCKK